MTGGSEASWHLPGRGFSADGSLFALGFDATAPDGGPAVPQQFIAVVDVEAGGRCAKIQAFPGGASASSSIGDLGLSPDRRMRALTGWQSQGDRGWLVIGEPREDRAAKTIRIAGRR
jgi:hypothetical protein